MNRRRATRFGQNGNAESGDGLGFSRSLALLAVAAVTALMVLSATAGGVSAERISGKGGAKNPPGDCPPGWVKAVHPLNPALGCIPATETAAGGVEKSDPNPGDCPDGFVKATPPLNPALGCIADTFVAESGPVLVVDPPIGCPDGFVPLENPQLGCIPTKIAVKVQTVSIVDPPIGCPEGWVPATPPLNPQLGCISDTLTSG